MHRRLALALVLLSALSLPAAALAAPAAPPDPNALTQPEDDAHPPAGHRLSGRRAAMIADGVRVVQGARRAHPGSTRTAFEKGADRWQVSYYSRAGKEIAQVTLNDSTGAVQEAWTGFQVAWTMARGYPGAFGRKAVALYVWIPLCLLFVAPFVDPRRLRRWLHLDLLVLVGLSVSLAFFSQGEIGLSVPLAYPVLLYLLARMVVIVRRRVAAPEPLKLLVPVSWLAVALVFLVGFRVGLNLVNSNVIDVGYAGVIGAHKLASGEDLYGRFPHDNPHGDTYGPVAYAAYVPFEQAWPWNGRWSDLPAAHAAAVAFDLLTLLGLWLLGRRVRGPTLGIVLAYAWAAFPFTLLALSSNTNDGLIALLVVGALLAIASPPGRGVLAALAGFAKFAPLALAPLLARGTGTLRARPVALFALGFALTAVVAAIPVIAQGDLKLFYDRTLGYQAARGSPFSVWGLWGLPHAAQSAVQAAGALFAIALAFWPRGARSVVQVAALTAAVLIALQLGVSHWFYLYVPWFFGPLMLALLGRYAEPPSAGGPPGVTALPAPG